MAIEIASAVAANTPVTKIANQNSGEPRELQRPNQSFETNTNNDRLILTAAAERIRQTEGRNSKPPVVDLQRIVAIQERISKGAYQIDAAQVADKMLNFEDSLYGTPRRTSKNSP